MCTLSVLSFVWMECSGGIVVVWVVVTIVRVLVAVEEYHVVMRSVISVF